MQANGRARMDKWQPADIGVRVRKPVPREILQEPAEVSRLEAVHPEPLAAKWPGLGDALVAYQRNVAAAFAEEAYWSVEEGVIRMEERQRLAARGRQLGLRPFDAELLIACALRDWAADHPGRRWKRAAQKKAGGLWKLWVGAAVAAIIMDAVVVVLLFK